MAGAAALALLGLAGCALDSESEVRARLDGWVTLGETEYFESEMGCTAGAFELRQSRFKSKVASVDTVEEGLRLLQQDWAVAFDLPGLSPSEVSEVISSRNLSEGIGVLASGVSSRDCMSDEIRRRYLAAVNAADSILVFDTTDNAMAIVDRVSRVVFFVRGSV